MPRSGTKLLRDLLNGNERIWIPEAESHFIPGLIRQFGDPPQFGDDVTFRSFYDFITRTNFYSNIQASGRSLRWSEVKAIGQRHSWTGILRNLFALCAPNEVPVDYVWGDKTPEYIVHMPMLAAVFPEARFLHIARDPRDVCLSVRRTWGKSIYRAAQRWNQRMLVAHRVGRELGSRYKVVTYEDLIAEPERVLESVCNYIGCSFSDDMLVLGQSTERHGGAKGLPQILAKNSGKYAAAFSGRETRRIEEITKLAAAEFGYKWNRNVVHKPLGTFICNVLRLSDGFAMARHYMSEKGLLGGMKYMFRSISS